MSFRRWPTVAPFDDLALLTLCDGYGGTELALRSLGRIRTVARVERDSYAAAVLVARMEEARLDRAPLWDDLETFDGRPWRGRVDIIAAGFPCQPWSTAGGNGGVDDPRWIWPLIARIIADVGPSIVLLENVPGLNATNWRKSGLQYVLTDLADLGFDAEWGLLSAAAVGAPHKRERFWLMAHTRHNARSRRRDEQPGRTDAQPSGEAVADTKSRRDGRQRIPIAQERTAAEGPGQIVGNAGRARHAAIAGGPHGDEGDDGPPDRDQPDGSDEDVADTKSIGRDQGQRPTTRGRRTITEDESAAHRWPPLPDDPDGWQRWVAEDRPEPAIRRRTDGPPEGLADARRLGGNGLVPQCAAAAWAQLADRLGAMK